jgi:hypothetical protein
VLDMGCLGDGLRRGVEWLLGWFMRFVSCEAFGLFGWVGT